MEMIQERMRAGIREQNPMGLHLAGSGGHFVLRFPEKDQLAWTPQLDLDVGPEEGRPDVNLVRCQIGPSPSVWMLFLGGYLALGLTALLGITLGMSQQFLHLPVWGYWLALPTPFLAFGLWWLAREGQRRSKDQMEALRRFVQEAFAGVLHGVDEDR